MRGHDDEDKAFTTMFIAVTIMSIVIVVGLGWMGWELVNAIIGWLGRH